MGRRKPKHKNQKNKVKIPLEASSSAVASPPPSPWIELPEDVTANTLQNLGAVEILETAQEVSSTSAPPWIDLPGDVTANILRRLGAVEILESAQKVCTTWRRICHDPAMWRVIHLKYLSNMHEQLSIMCRVAVDRSQGQLVDLIVDHFGDDELLNYVADRSSQLRRLTMHSCYEISGQGLTEAVKKLPHLEELHLIIMPSVQAGDIETIGISCRLLKSFTFNKRGSKHPLPKYLEYDEFVEGFGYNDYALATAKTMPNLHHLRFFAHSIKNDGLQAILDGCPYLKSLDVRQCFGLDLGGDLGKRCSVQIKDLKRPSDSIGDIWWLAGEPSYAWYSDLSFDSWDSVLRRLHHEDYEDYEDYEYYYRQRFPSRHRDLRWEF